MSTSSSSRLRWRKAYRSLKENEGGQDMTLESEQRQNRVERYVPRVTWKLWRSKMANRKVERVADLAELEQSLHLMNALALDSNSSPHIDVKVDREPRSFSATHNPVACSKCLTDLTNRKQLNSRGAFMNEKKAQKAEVPAESQKSIHATKSPLTLRTDSKLGMVDEKNLTKKTPAQLELQEALAELQARAQLKPTNYVPVVVCSICSRDLPNGRPVVSKSGGGSMCEEKVEEDLAEWDQKIHGEERVHMSWTVDLMPRVNVKVEEKPNYAIVICYDCYEDWQKDKNVE